MHFEEKPLEFKEFKSVDGSNVVGSFRKMKAQEWDLTDLKNRDLFALDLEIGSYYL